MTYLPQHFSRLTLTPCAFCGREFLIDKGMLRSAQARTAKAGRPLMLACPDQPCQRLLAQYKLDYQREHDRKRRQRAKAAKA